MINIHILLFLLFAQNIYTLLINDPLITTSWGNGGGGGRPGRPGRPNRPNQNYTYTCVPVGTCPGGSGIDPRIVTPVSITYLFQDVSCFFPKRKKYF